MHGLLAVAWRCPVLCFNPLPLPSFPVYLLDDGRDIEKKKFIHGLGLAEAVYIRWGCCGEGRRRGEAVAGSSGENVKSCHCDTQQMSKVGCALAPPDRACSGRKRAKGEMNGKSCNINNAVRQIYPEGRAIALTEVVCVFDADQVGGRVLGCRGL
jgi:hypothetical protein